MAGNPGSIHHSRIMSARPSRFLLLLSALLAGGLTPSMQAAGSPAPAWTQFRGPAQGHADNADVPLTWSETEHVKWKTPLPGEGWSSPVIAGNQIWMTTALDDGKSLHALCCSLQTGQILIDVEVFKNEAPASQARPQFPTPRPLPSSTATGYTSISAPWAPPACPTAMAEKSGRIGISRSIPRMVPAVLPRFTRTSS